MTVLSFSGAPPLIEIIIAPRTGTQQLMAQANRPVVRRPVRLLIDTGSSHTAIDEDELRALGIHASGKTFVRTMASSVGVAPQHNTYRVSLLLTCAQAGRSVLVDDLKVTAPDNRPFAGTGYVGLLGRDVLDRGLLMYDGNGGHCALSF